MALTDYTSALVTGASSGVGAACVRALRGRGVEVLALARRADRLAELAAETGCKTLVLDLKDTDAVHRELPGLEADILINNAGLGRGYGGFLHSSPADIDAMVDLNVAAAFHVTRAVAAGMVERKRGHIVQISSLAALYPLGFPVYGGTKGAVHLFSQHFRTELSGSPVRHTEICPGRIATEFFDAAFQAEADKQAFLSGYSPLVPDDVAQAVMYALDTPWHVNVATIELTPTEQVPGGAIIKSAGRD
ncbi:MAG: SDR family oxidoreductase [Rhodospirillaceae bacterium]